MDAHIANWSEEDQRIDRAYVPNNIEVERLKQDFMLRLATKEEVVRETDRIAALERKRVAGIKKQTEGHPNHTQIMQGLEFQAKTGRKRRDVFLRYFSVPRTLIYWFEDREIGIVGWAVHYDGQLARILNLKAELFPEK